jgi:hypothetical protein
MNSLSSRQQSFIKLMKESEDYERRGFELLLKRPDFAAFFDALANEGLFDPSRNSGPVAADKPGYYRIPYWPPLPYLEAAARFAGEQADAALADKVMDVIRSVSQWRDSDGKPRDNHSTWHAFAKMLGLLPTSAVSMADIDLLPAWLKGRFNRSMVGHALASGTLRNFLTSEDPVDWAKACRILYHCTAIEFVDEGLATEKTTIKVRTLVEDYWIKDLINASAAAFGRKAGKDAGDVFLTRLQDVFAHAMGGRDTWLFRPAIEDHQQNYDWRGPYNRFVEGLRNTVLAWIDSDAEAAQPYVESLLSAGSEIVERVAIHLVDQRFEALRGLVPKAISPSFFDSGHRHELHLFLKNHFRQFSLDEKTATLDAIRGLPVPDRGDDSERLYRRIQQNWLSAIAGQGYEPADTWLAELNDTLGSTGSFPRPDLNSYHETRWGFGPTPHNVQDLIAFARGGTIVDQLNAFTPSNAWDGPSKRSLADAVIDAVGAAPKTFVDHLPQFLKAKPEYQYAIIAGFKKLWDAWDGKPAGLAWDAIWPKLIDFFEALLTDEAFWKGEATEEPELSPTRDWIPPAISEFLRAGTGSDDKAYAPDLLPRTLPLVVILLNKSEQQKESAEGDALNRAINTAKGKAVEALLDHALRRCRLSDQTKKSHAHAWQELEPLFDAELAGCRNGNFEFSALTGAYIGNLHYMSSAWVHDNFTRIFPVEFPANCLSALDGLAFAPQMEPVYTALVGSGVLDWALRQEMKGEHARETLLQRIGLAYLWDQEKLDGPRFSYLFEARRIGDLEDVGNYFWMIRGEPLKDEQKERIFLFWDRCVTWSKTLDCSPASLLSLLSLLSCYLTAIDERSLEWLLAVAPHTPVNYNADRLIEELGRLAGDNAAKAGQVLRVLLEAYQPDYDFEDRLKRLIVELAGHSESRADAIRCVERVRHLPGMVQIYAQL